MPTTAPQSDMSFLGFLKIAKADINATHDYTQGGWDYYTVKGKQVRVNEARTTVEVLA